jgi:hypothetical protein
MQLSVVGSTANDVYLNNDTYILGYIGTQIEVTTSNDGLSIQLPWRQTPDHVKRPKISPLCATLMSNKPEIFTWHAARRTQQHLPQSRLSPPTI